MTQNEDVIFHAKMTMAAWKNPYGSVERVFPLAIDGFRSYPGTFFRPIQHRFQTVAQYLITAGYQPQ